MNARGCNCKVLQTLSARAYATNSLSTRSVGANTARQLGKSRSGESDGTKQEILHNLARLNLKQNPSKGGYSRFGELKCSAVLAQHYRRVLTFIHGRGLTDPMTSVFLYVCEPHLQYFRHFWLGLSQLPARPSCMAKLHY